MNNNNDDTFIRLLYLRQTDAQTQMRVHNLYGISNIDTLTFWPDILHLISTFISYPGRRRTAVAPSTSSGQCGQALPPRRWHSVNIKASLVHWPEFRQAQPFRLRRFLLTCIIRLWDRSSITFIEYSLFTYKNLYLWFASSLSYSETFSIKRPRSQTSH